MKQEITSMISLEKHYREENDSLDVDQTSYYVLSNYENNAKVCTKEDNSHGKNYLK